MKKKYGIVLSFVLLLIYLGSCSTKTPPSEGNPPVNPPVEEHTHSWGNWVEEKAATCTDKGKKIRKCSGCKEEEFEDIPALNHSYKNGYCTRCDAVDPNNKEMIDGKEFTFIQISKDGILSFSRLKCASKYVLTLVSPGENSKTVELEKTQGSYSLADLPVGRTMVTLTAYENVEVKIENETHYQEVPISTATEEFRITKLNQTYTLERLKYIDEHVVLNGFYDEIKMDEATAKKYYLYDFVLKNNKATSFKIQSHITLPSGYKAVYYKSAEGRENENSSDVWSSTELSMGYPQVQHGNNFYYVRIKDANNNFYDYDLNVYGLYTVEIERYSVQLGTDPNGYRTYEKEKLGDTLTYVEKDIIPVDVLYENVDEKNLGRDTAYNIMEREDYVLMLSSSIYPDTNQNILMPIYFYDEETVREDSEEYKAYSKNFNISEYDSWITLSSSGSQVIGDVTIPSALVGKKVASVEFFMSEVTTLYIAEGATEFVVSFSYCTKVTDIWLPSTIVTMQDFAFGANVLNVLPNTVTIHCAFSQSYANQFSYKWNQIAGTTKKFNTVYGVATPIIENGIRYVIKNNELIVQGTTSNFNGILPDEVKLYGKVYPVTTIEHIDATKEIYIGKNIHTIYENAFVEAVESIEVDAENTYFVVENGVLYNENKDRIVVATKNTLEFHVGTSIVTIDKNAFTNCAKAYIYTSYESLPSLWQDCDFNDVILVLNFKELVSENDFEYIITNANTACLISYKGNQKEVQLDSTVQGALLTEVASNAFKDCTALEAVAFPDSIVKFGTSLFEGCTNLKKITTPYLGTDLDTAISLSSFTGEDVYQALESITLTQVKNLADEAFKDCASLTELSISDTLEKIGTEMFIGCTSLQFFEEDGISYLGNSNNPKVLLVDVMDKSITEVTISKDCKVISPDAFTGCNQLIKVSLSIHSLDLFPIKTITDIVLLGGESIDKKTLKDYSSIVNLMLPATLKDIEIGSFDTCSNLKNLEISNENPYYSITNGIIYNKNQTEVIGVLIHLETLEFADTVEQFGSGILKNAKNLKKISIPFIGKSINDTENKTFGYLFGDNSLVPESLTEVAITKEEIIPAGAFSGCKYITKILLPSTLSGIERYAFSNCNNLVDIELPNTLLSIGERAFAYCGFSTLSLPSSLTSIGLAAFIGCANLGSITIPFIGGGADSQYMHFGYIFGANKASDNSKSVPASLKEVIVTGGLGVTSKAFMGCRNLTTIILPEGMVMIADYAFSGCNQLTHLSIPDSLRSLYMNSSDDGLDKCKNLVYNEYKNGLYLGNEENPYVIFVKPDRTVSTLEIHNQTKIIHAYAYMGSTFLSRIILPKSVVWIGNSAFDGCTNLSEIFYTGTYEEWQKVAKGMNNAPLTTAKVNFYSEEEPTNSGNYWHYVDGYPVNW